MLITLYCGPKHSGQQTVKHNGLQEHCQNRVVSQAKVGKHIRSCAMPPRKILEFRTSEQQSSYQSVLNLGIS